MAWLSCWYVAESLFGRTRGVSSRGNPFQHACHAHDGGQSLASTSLSTRQSTCTDNETQLVAPAQSQFSAVRGPPAF